MLEVVVERTLEECLQPSCSTEPCQGLLRGQFQSANIEKVLHTKEWPSHNYSDQSCKRCNEGRLHLDYSLVVKDDDRENEMLRIKQRPARRLRRERVEMVQETPGSVISISKHRILYMACQGRPYSTLRQRCAMQTCSCPPTLDIKVQLEADTLQEAHSHHMQSRTETDFSHRYQYAIIPCLRARDAGYGGGNVSHCVRDRAQMWKWFFLCKFDMLLAQ